MSKKEPYKVPEIEYPPLSSINESTGDRMMTKSPSQAYLDNYDLIFRNKKLEVEAEDGKD